VTVVEHLNPQFSGTLEARYQMTLPAYGRKVRVSPSRTPGTLQPFDAHLVVVAPCTTSTTPFPVTSTCTFSRGGRQVPAAKVTGADVSTLTPVLVGKVAVAVNEPP
jgi:hypothetical protein